MRVVPDSIGPKGAYTAPVRMSETNDSGAAEILNMSHGAPTTPDGGLRRKGDLRTKDQQVVPARW